MKKLSKILVLILAVALICTGLALVVSADNGTPGATYTDTDGAEQSASTLEAAVAAAADNTVIALTGDTTVEATISFDKRITLDLKGYTLTSKAATLFEAADNVSFDIIGSGRIDLDGMLVHFSKTYTADFSVIGSGKGISINHNGTLSQTVSLADTGVLEFKNVDVVAIPNKDTAFKTTSGGTATYDMTGVTIDTTGSTTVDSNSGVFYISKNGHLHLKNCNIDTNGVVVEMESQSERSENFITIDGCYIRSYNKSVDTAIFGSYATIWSDILVKDSYLESTNRPIMVNDSKNGAAVILDNSTLNHNGDKGNQISRTCNVIAKNGSKIDAMYSSVILFHDTYNTSKGALEGFSATPVHYYLYEGVRFNQHVYNAMVNLDMVQLKDSTDTVIKSHYKEEYIRFVEVDAEGNETFVKPSDSTKLTIVFDPAGDKGSPYVVAPITETTPVLFNKADDGTLTRNDAVTVSEATDGIAGEVIYYSQYGVTRTQWNNSNLSYGNCGVNGDVAFRYTLNGKTNASGANFIWGLKSGEGIQKKTTAAPIDVLVYDFDIAAGSEDGFIPGSITLHNRATVSDSTNESIGLVNISQDGTVTNRAPLVEKALDTYQLNRTGWNHVSIVIETKSNTGSAFLFINGTYIARYKAMDDQSKDNTTYMFGPRYDAEVKNGHALASNTSLEMHVDNVLIRTEGTGTFEHSPMTEAAAREYLVNGGKAWRNDNPVGGNAGGISVGGVQFDNLNDALIKANELGISVNVNGNIEQTQKVTVSGSVRTNGYAIPLTKDSLGANVTFDSEGNVAAYEFDEKYTETVTVKWFVGSHRSAAALASDDYYVIETVKIGHLPMYTDEKVGYDYYKEGDTVYVAGKRTGWSTSWGKDTAETILPVTAESADTLVYYPTYTGFYKVTDRYIILNSNGLYNRSGNLNKLYGSDWWNATNRIDTYGKNYSIGLQYGETFVLCKDDVTFIGGFGAPRANNGEAKVYNIDLNGHVMNIRAEMNSTGKTPNYFQVKVGETMNFYSSVSGAVVNVYGMAQDAATDVSGGKLFNMSGSGLNTIEGNISDATNNDTHLNIGTVTVHGETYSGKNLTINGDTLVELGNGDKTCSVNIEDITYVKTVNYYGSVIVNAYFNGTVNVKNSNFFFPNGGTFIDGKSWGITDVNGDGKKDKSDVDNPNAVRVAATAVIDGCYLFTASNGTNDSKGNLSNGDYTYKSILYTNCVTNGRIGGSITGLAIRIGDNCRVYTPTAQKIDGVDKALYNRDMTIADTGLETVTVKYVADFTKTSATNITFNLAEFTYAVPTAESKDTASLVLPHFVYNHVSAENTVDVTYTDLATGNTVTDKYSKGGDVVIGATSYEGTALNATHKGTWTIGDVAGCALPTNIQESVTLVPEFDVTVKVSGLKANLSLYSDFLVNLYVPAAYAEYVKVNGADITANAVTLGEASFVKATVAKNAKEASSDALFEIAIAEAGYTATKTVTLSIADYAAQILAGEQFADTDKALMYYMLNYAAEAAKYLGGAADEELEALVAANAKWNVVKVEKTFANAIANIGLDAIFASSGITLGEAPAFTFTPNGKFTGTVTVTYGNGNVRTFTVPADSTAKLTVEGMKIYNFGTNLTVTAVGTVAGMEGEQTIVGTINLDTYAKYHTENAANAESATAAESAEALDLINALYDYVKVAEQYKAGTLTLPEEAPAE